MRSIYTNLKLISDDNQTLFYDQFHQNAINMLDHFSKGKI